MIWPMTQIGQFTHVVTKGTTPTKKQGFSDSGINYIKAEALNGDSTLDLSGGFFISEDVHQSLKRSVLEEGDVLLTIAGANIGKCGIVEERHLPANTNQAVGIMRVDQQQVAPRFLYYWFKQPQTFRYIQGLNAQAAQPNINLSMLRNIEVPLPSISEQRHIASVLSAYDDLIENNRRRIQLLEQSVRLLYKEWFIHLRFPGHEHTKIIDGVPDGWQKSTVGDSTSFLSRGITPNYEDSAPGLVINQKCIRNRMVSLELARRQSKQVPPTKLVQFGDVLINSTGAGTLGRIAQFLLNTNECTVDSHITIVRPQKDVPVYYFGLHLTDLEPYITTLGRGATNQTELSKDDIAALEMIIPSSGPAEIFESIVAPSFRQICILSEQIEKLIKVRDLLLPKLMNGEVAV